MLMKVTIALSVAQVMMLLLLETVTTMLKPEMVLTLLFVVQVMM